MFLYFFSPEKKWKEAVIPRWIHKTINNDKNNILTVINDHTDIPFKAIDHLIVTSVALCAKEKNQPASHGV